MFRQVARSAAVTARALSTTALRSAEAPVQLFGIEGRYAHALYSAASQKKALDNVEKELDAVKTLMGTNADFADFLKNPVLSRAEKSDIVQEVMKSQKFSETTINFFGALAENNRLAETGGVIDAYKTLMKATRGEVTCKVTSASDLKPAQKKSIEAALSSFVPSSQKVSVTYETEPSLVGGFVVDVGEKHIDLSVRSKVQKYSSLLRESL
ncbi:uncharacterized protein MONBRDRAFT_18525 [Monosiga brevicollis MX1]|uniref:ATP synthase subunit 5, mitochondrial n=1 Tax=Monosiga brevicollis TaxID=81824 RepID=A9UW64_MONBE|nr:uncharacterized protein MONBRDRAFT_18525 [Monosiga brevicollis MX1]EDQ90507.1 predicted protein [Monosiga brevicollis MX1]|eukprot:XP_001744558.1 hypothetical protein [Monosiga brevicollis MX1]